MPGDQPAGTEPDGPVPPDPEATATVEQAAAAIASGAMQDLNQALHPRAVADLSRIAGEDDPPPGPVITGFTVTPLPGGTEREPLFDITFLAPGRVSVLRVQAARAAARWRIARVLDIRVEHRGDP